jgi:TRAP-type mannitol/chloroaromatic compound transport system substrate-binding protein
MKKRVLVTIVGVILVASFLIIGLAAPVQAVTKWKYQSMWVPSITLWRGDKYFGDLMNVLAAGELEIKYFPGGTLVKTSNEIFDAVVAGSIQMATDWPSYWEGKNTAFGLISGSLVMFSFGRCRPGQPMERPNCP